MDKAALLRCIVDELEANHELLLRAANAAHEEATHEESTAENKYDTRGLEASYLAEAQSRRATELEQTIRLFKSMKPRSFSDEDNITLGALVELSDEDDSQWFFLAARAGGTKVTLEGQTISILTPQSPLGKQLMGAQLGDPVELRLRNKTVEYEILQLF